MFTRKLIDFLFSGNQHTTPPATLGSSAKAEFEWPPSAEDMDAFSVVPLHADDGSETQPASDVR